MNILAEHRYDDWLMAHIGIELGVELLNVYKHDTTMFHQLVEHMIDHGYGPHHFRWIYRTILRMNDLIGLRMIQLYIPNHRDVYPDMEAYSEAMECPDMTQLDFIKCLYQEGGCIITKRVYIKSLQCSSDIQQYCWTNRSFTWFDYWTRN